MKQDPQDSRSPDRGSPFAAKVAWIAGILLIGILIILNQSPALAPPEQPATQQLPTIEPPALLDGTGAISKFLVKLAHAMVKPDDQVSRTSLVGQVDQAAQSQVDRLRAALAVAELSDPESGVARLTILKNDPKLAENVRADLLIFEQMLTSKDPMLVEPASHEGLINRHGWFAKLALSRGMDDSNPSRAPLIDGGGRIVLVIAYFVMVAFVAVLGGIGCFAAAVAMAALGKFKTKFQPPNPGGSVFLEVVPVFAAGFLVIKVLLPVLISGPDGLPDWAMKASLLAQWGLVPLCLWPLVRHTRWADFRARLGWHSGKGIAREIIAGIFGYMACLPLFAAAVVVSLLLALVFRGAGPGGGAPQVQNPVVDMISKAGTLELMMFFVLATCWAPLVEEAVFRGAFFRHLRSRLPLLGAAAISACVFGAMHGYEFFMLGPVISLGFTFALIREWRGSLIGCMTAHFLHNATALSFMMLLLPILRD